MVHISRLDVVSLVEKKRITPKRNMDIAVQPAAVAPNVLHVSIDDKLLSIEPFILEKRSNVTKSDVRISDNVCSFVDTSNSNTNDSTVTRFANLKKIPRTISTPIDANEDVVMLCDDSLRIIVSFLNLNSVLALRSVNAHTNSIITRHKDLWKEMSLKNFNTEVKEEDAFNEFFIKCKQAKITEKKKIRNLEKFKKVYFFQKLLRYLYGVICPPLFTVGVFIQVTFLPAILGGNINIKASYFPFLFLLTTFLVILPYVIIVCTCSIDALLVNPFKGKIVKSGLPNNMKPKILFIENRKMEDTIARYALVIFIWALFSIPLQITIFNLYFMIGMGRTSFFCIPQYIYTILFASLPVAFFVRLYKKARIDVEFNRSYVNYAVLAYVYFLGVLFNVLLSIQIGLICARVDEIIMTNWIIIFVPTWVFSGILSLHALGYNFYISAFWRYLQPTITSAIIFLYQLTFLFVSVFIVLGTILVGLKLDNTIEGTFYIVFIPIIFGVASPMSISLLCSMLCFGHISST
jgi:hypothetical protein